MKSAQNLLFGELKKRKIICFDLNYLSLMCGQQRFRLILAVWSVAQALASASFWPASELFDLEQHLHEANKESTVDSVQIDLLFFFFFGFVPLRSTYRRKIVYQSQQNDDDASPAPSNRPACAAAVSN